MTNDKAMDDFPAYLKGWELPAAFPVIWRHLTFFLTMGKKVEDRTSH